MKIIKNFPISGLHSKPIVSDLYYEETATKKPLIIFCHGYKGFKNWGAFDLMPSKFLDAGFGLLKFNFSHNGGTLNQPIDFPDLEAFGNNNYTIELDDLDSVIKWVISCEEIQDQLDTHQIILIGHSRGGGIATIKASEDSRIKKLVTWAAVCDLDRPILRKGRALEAWKKEGVFFVRNERTREKMPHYIQFYQNFIQNKSRLNIEKAARKISIPHLIFHGEKDFSVLKSHAENLHTWNPSSELLIVPEANHVFGASHPWKKEALPKDLAFVVEKTIDFIQRC